MSTQSTNVHALASSARLLTPAELSEYLGISVGALAQLRYTGRGPAFTKAGRQVRYRWVDIQAYLDENRRTMTAS